MPHQEGLFEALQPTKKERRPIAEPEINDAPFSVESPRPSSQSLDIVVHPEQIEHVLGTLLELYRMGGYPYNKDSVRVPQDPRHMPESLPLGDKEHAMFLWTSCYYMRGGIKSVEAFRRLSRLYTARPDLFDPEVAQAASEDEITQELTQHGLGFQASVSKAWISNAKKLVADYSGDPRTIFDGVTSYDQALEKIKNDGKGGGFLGFREKMTSMIIYYLMDQKLIEPLDFPVPVDLHVMRVSIANELISFPGAEPGTNLYTEETLAALRAIYQQYAVDHQVSPLDLANAVWLFSEAMCGYQPGNQTLEPEGREHRRGRSTHLEPLAIDFGDPLQHAAFARTCGRCAIRETCRYNIPGKPYYVQGVLMIRGERQDFPQTQHELF